MTDSERLTQHINDLQNDKTVLEGALERLCKWIVKNHGVCPLEVGEIINCDNVNCDKYPEEWEACWQAAALKGDI